MEMQTTQRPSVNIGEPERPKKLIFVQIGKNHGENFWPYLSVSGDLERVQEGFSMDEHITDRLFT